MTWTHSDSIAASLLWLDDAPGERAIETLDEFAPLVLAYAQTNAPWNDRTGYARSELQVTVSDDDYSGIYSLVLAHGMDYGYWLEVIQNGRFAIVMPTLEAFADEIFNESGARFMGIDEL